MVTQNDNSARGVEDRHYWVTPPEMMATLQQEFHFDFDPCPPNPAFDGLTVSWGKRNFVNPPYGNEAKKWIRKGYEESLQGKLEEGCDLAEPRQVLHSQAQS